VSPSDVTPQLERILGSPGFRQAGSLSRFLRYIVEESLAGRGDAIKEYSVGVAVFDRGESFDPKTDTIVRVQARRLRTKLEEYYAERGGADPVVIELPKGTYNPVFSAREVPQTPPNRKLRWAAAALILTALMPVAWLAAMHSPKPAFSSLAVLPFDNLSHNPDEEWFSDGMTETLITELSKVRSLKLVSRTSSMRFKGAPRRPLKEIARELGVDAVVEGSALRVGNRVRITAQLIASASDTHLWGNDYDGDFSDVLSLQRSVAQSIAQAVGAAASPNPKTQAPVDPQAMADYLKGLDHFNRNDIWTAIDLARDAIRVSPGFAAAHELLGRALIWQGDQGAQPYDVVLPEGRAALRRALELEPDRAASLEALGGSYMTPEHNWDRAELYLRRSYELSPADAGSYGFFLSARGRNAEAVRWAEQAVPRDPANARLLTDAARIYHFARRYDDAIRLFHKAQEIAPRSTYWRYMQPNTLWQSGRRDEAVAAWRAYEMDVKTRLGRDEAFWQSHSQTDWHELWTAYLERRPAVGLRDKLLPLIGLGRYPEAVSELEALEKKVDSGLLITLEDPLFDPLRPDPRFRAILQRLDYPRSMWQ
jgi:TolB-like protein